MAAYKQDSWGVRAESPFLVSVVRWMARVASLGLVAVLALFLFGGRETGIPSATEVIAFVLFPIGLVAGTLWAWRDEIRGGGLALGSLAAFHAWSAILNGRLWLGPFILILAIPALVLLLCGLVDRQRARGGS